MKDKREPKLVIGRATEGSLRHAVRVVPVRDSNRYTEADKSYPIPALCDAKCAVIEYENSAEDVVINGGRICRKCDEAVRFSLDARFARNQK